MTYYEYLCVPVTMWSPQIIELYNLTPLIHKGFVYAKIHQGMYGLPQAGCIAYDQLVDILGLHEYLPSPTIPGLWKHKMQLLQFTLVVDDFGIKYINEHDVQHLLASLAPHFKCSCDWTGK